MIKKEFKRKKKSTILIIGIIISSFGLLFMIIPFPSNIVIENLGQFGISKGVSHVVHYNYHMFSHNQELIISLGAVNSSFSILVIDDSNFEAWNNDEGGYLPIYEETNTSGIYTSLYLNQPFIGNINIIITAETLLEIYGSIQTKFLFHYFIEGLFCLVIGVILIISLILKIFRVKNLAEKSVFN